MARTSECGGPKASRRRRAHAVAITSNSTRLLQGPVSGGGHFSASGEKPGQFRPGQLEYPVDGRGVIFSGKTREPICEGLTRPHSARLHGADFWVANSGYGEVVRIRGAKLETIARLPGWTRGLWFVNNVLFVGTSRVILRYARYAPGLKVNESICGVHAIDATNGKRLGSISVAFWQSNICD